jgi:hypothetical protein
VPAAAADTWTAARVAALEDAWRPSERPDVGPPPGLWGAEPYPAGAFGWLLRHAMAAVPERPVFGDAGAGVGGKVLLAAAAGCRAWGVELVPAYAAAARAAGADVRTGRVLDADWSGTDIVFANQLLRDARLEAAYEGRLRGLLAPGTALISVNHAAPPGPGWTALLVDDAAARGVWLKAAR